MQLTELLFQKVKGLPPQGQLGLKPGYVAIVSRSSSLRAALVAPLCPAPDDQRRLVDGQGPTRVGVGVLSADGTPFRLLRELGGQRTLLRFDAAARRFVPLTGDQLEIESWLRVECGMPSPDDYASFFVLEINELPSLRTKSAASVSDAYVDADKVKSLKEELALTQRFEGIQDRQFKVVQTLHDLREAQQKLEDALAEAQAARDELARSPWTPEQIADLTARAGRAKDDLREREEAMAEVAKRRQRNAQMAPAAPEPFLTSPWFWGGIAAGIALDALAFFFKRPSIALPGLIPYLIAVIAVLRWIEADEKETSSVALVKELKDKEIEIRKSYEAEAAPLKAALKSANVDEPKELLALFDERKVHQARFEEAQTRVKELQQDPMVKRARVELAGLEEEKQRLDAEIQKTGYTRSIGDVEGDLREAMGIVDTKAKQVAEGDVPSQLIERAAGLLAVPAEGIWQQIGQRFSAYLNALTDQRVASARRDDKGQLILSAPDGRSGPYTGLPPQLRDLAYVALRLTLLERVATQKKLPVVVDDSFASLEPGKRMLVSKMLKGIGTQTQVLHRLPDAPPPGAADLVVNT